MISLIDGDIICYRSAAAAENDGVEYALLNTDRLMRTILAETEATSFNAWISASDKSNFRYKENPLYKANRKDKPKPIHLEACRRFLTEEWGAVTVVGAEADDALSIAQDKEGVDGVYETVICSIDKDLLQVPGFHYNFVRKEFSQVSYIGGIKFFYKQMLIGDTVDYIQGVVGLGKAKAAKIIDPLTTEKEMYEVVCNLYKDPDRFDMNANCLWLYREDGIRFTDRW